ncbi:MAG: VIT1/CCC1 transporter family protein [Verrucomicrobia bacterium]|nr:VIT1/CCC1 transporter family protein [Verrucomicrobiota bacterium]
MDNKTESEGSFAHFQGKEAIQHIVQVQADGILTTSETHGAETPGFIFAACDAARETAIVLLLIALLLGHFEFTAEQLFSTLASFACAWMFWKIGRSAWLCWYRLERLHRVMDEERNEIEVHRSQERIELKALYAAKGFQGKLLDDVIDVLMADKDRLLRVMLEEEMGFRLQENEHPLTQGLGAGVGVLITSLLALGGFAAWAQEGMIISAVITISIASFLGARIEHNRVINAILWNLGLATFAYCVAYYCMIQA